jgi:hypothetical protein
LALLAGYQDVADFLASKHPRLLQIEQHKPKDEEVLYHVDYT